jgi:DNA-binding transcriptional regulator YiaG
MQTLRGETIRHVRQARGLNLEQLAKLVEVPVARVEAWECGQAEPVGLDWLLLCIRLGEDLGYFTGEHGPKTVAA